MDRSFPSRCTTRGVIPAFGEHSLPAEKEACSMKGRRDLALTRQFMRGVFQRRPQVTLFPHQIGLSYPGGQLRIDLFGRTEPESMHMMPRRDAFNAPKPRPT